MQLVLNWFWHLLPGNPMVVRVVQGGSQRLRHLWVRMGYLAGLIGLILFGLMTGGGMGQGLNLTDMAIAGTKVFTFVAYGQVIFVCLLAPLFMAGAIAQERSGETYNILLTTPLSNLQIVLGSLFGRLFFVWTLVASGIPLFAVLLIFGGVPIRSVFVAFATAGLVALMVGAVAVTLSVLRAGGRKAVFSFVILIAAYLVTIYAFDAAILRKFSSVPDTTTWLTPLHPILVLESTLSKAKYRPPTPDELVGYSDFAKFYLSKPFATFAIITASISSILVIFSSVMVRNIGTGDSRLMIAVKKWLRIDAGGGERTRPAREVWHNPIAWREANTRGHGVGGILSRYGFLFIAVVAVTILLYLHHNGALPPIPGIGGKASSTQTFYLILNILLITELAVIVLVALYMSAGAVSREREDGTLDLMLTTPITPKYYIWGKLRGLVSFLALLIAAPVATLAIVSLYSFFGDLLGWEGATVDHIRNLTTDRYDSWGNRVNTAPRTKTIEKPLMILEAGLLLLMMLVPFVSLCIALGMNWSLKSKTVLGAIIPSVAIVAVFSLITGFCGMAIVQEVAFIGPVINAFSPVTNVWMIVDPWSTVSQFAEEPIAGRVSLFFAAIICAGGYAGIVYAIILNMVRGFDQTVRKLSGTA